MIIYGVKDIRKKLGIQHEEKECPVCHNKVKFILYRIRTFISLFLIPMIPIKKKYALMCPVCDNGEYIEKENLDSELSKISI